MKTLRKTFILLGLSFIISHGLTAQTVETTWESINQRGYPQWFSDAKLGIFIHWGLYSIPAYASPEGYGEWFYKGLMSGDTGRMAMMQRFGGDPSKSALEQYSVLPAQWKAEMWNPDEWASLFKQAGAQYVLLVTKHHDGYCLWDWQHPVLPNWTSVLSGPKRNIVEELTTAVRKQNLKMGMYFSLAEWTNPIHIWTVSPNDSIARYVETYMIPQFKDLITKYKPEVLFTDGEWDNNAEQWHARELISWYYNTVGSDAIVNDRWGDGHQHGYKTPEYSGGIMDTVTPWAECRGLGRSFGINHNELLSNYLSSKELIQHFVKLVAAGGGLTLNVGPEADGRIPFIQQERLLDLGNWLKINGEAIYASKPYSNPYEYTTPLTLIRTDSIIDFDWVRNAPLKGMTYDNFDICWSGEIEPDFSEKYTFNVEVDDNVIVILDNDTLINYNKSFANETASNAQEAKNYSRTQATIKLKKGQHYHLKVLYEEKDLEARIRLHWKSKSQREEAIPAINGFSGIYRCLLPSICYTKNGNNLYATILETPVNSVILHNLPTNYKVKRVSLLGYDKPLEFTLEGNELKINFNLSDIQIHKIPTPWVIKLTDIIQTHPTISD